jgi:hypothetical protein
VDSYAATALAAVVGGNGDIDGAIERPKKAPKDGGSPVAQHSAGAASENRGHPAGLFAESHVPEGVDTLM